jgi:hypothetical protein
LKYPSSKYNYFLFSYIGAPLKINGVILLPAWHSTLTFLTEGMDRIQGLINLNGKYYSFISTKFQLKFRISNNFDLKAANHNSDHFYIIL